MLDRGSVHHASFHRQALEALAPILCCPRCKSALHGSAEEWRCTNAVCFYGVKAFRVIDGTPVLIDFENSIFDEKSFARRAGQSAIGRDLLRKSARSRARDFIFGSDTVQKGRAERFASLLPPGARVLIIGGGVMGIGTKTLYENPGFTVIGTDVYVSPIVSIVSDAHQLPFTDGSIDGVWIQAVLEHVLEPHVVVREIERVLKPGGIVYADTPFMQQVHEGAYDFTRFTLSGQRWLLRNFEEIESGIVGGAGTSLVWSLRYFVRSITASNRIATASTLFYFWLRFFDGLGRARPSADAACGVYLLGRKSDRRLKPPEMVAYYAAWPASPVRPVRHSVSNGGYGRA